MTTTAGMCVVTSDPTRPAPTYPCLRGPGRCNDGRPMRVIGAGFGRTGTLSFKHALAELGFGPTYHMQEVIRRPSHIDAWLHYARTGEADWDRLFAGFGSGVDYPVSCAWEEL